MGGPELRRAARGTHSLHSSTMTATSPWSVRNWDWHTSVLMGPAIQAGVQVLETRWSLFVFDKARVESHLTPALPSLGSPAARTLRTALDKHDEHEKHEDTSAPTLQMTTEGRKGTSGLRDCRSRARAHSASVFRTQQAITTADVDIRPRMAPFLFCDVSTLRKTGSTRHRSIFDFIK